MMYAPSFTPVLDEMNGVDVSLWKMDHQNPFGRVGGHIPVNPLAIPPWCTSSLFKLSVLRELY